jgi:hypothetical protein
LARNRSPNAPRLFPPALHPNRDAFKNVCLFRCLPKIGGAAVEEGSAAIDANRDTRRRRSCTGWREGLSGLGRTLVGRRCTRDCGPWILNLSFAAACSNNRDADKLAFCGCNYCLRSISSRSQHRSFCSAATLPNGPLDRAKTVEIQTDILLRLA